MKAGRPSVGSARPKSPPPERVNLSLTILDGGLRKADEEVRARRR